MPSEMESETRGEMRPETNGETMSGTLSEKKLSLGESLIEPIALAFFTRSECRLDSIGWPENCIV
jgi:hypothetical protein